MEKTIDLLTCRTGELLLAVLGSEVMAVRAMDKAELFRGPVGDSRILMAHLRHEGAGLPVFPLGILAGGNDAGTVSRFLVIGKAGGGPLCAVGVDGEVDLVQVSLHEILPLPPLLETKSLYPFFWAVWDNGEAPAVLYTFEKTGSPGTLAEVLVKKRQAVDNGQ